MLVKQIRFITAAAILVAMPAIANAWGSGVVEFQNHYYKIVKDPGISWDDAKAAAEATYFMGVQGHLATLTSQAEDEFVEGLRQSKLGHKQAWVGGVQAPGNCAPQPGCNWEWLGFEPKIPTAQFPGPLYTNWGPGQPDDSDGAEHMAIGKYGWNDEGNPYKVGGYVIEYDTGIPIADCVDPNTCLPNHGMKLTLPSSVTFPAGAQIWVNNFEYIDDQSRCGSSTLTVLDDDGVAGNEVIVPNYLCGSPRFLVAALDASAVSFTQDVVEAESEVTINLPNNIYECTGPISGGGGPYPPPYTYSISGGSGGGGGHPPYLPNPKPSLDPQHRDVFAWQSTDPTEMIELALGPSFGLPGAVTELTYDCGSARGRVRKGSYFISGLHIDFGPGFEYASNPHGNHYKFVELQLYKLKLLKQSVMDAAPALSVADFNALLMLVKKAIKLHNQGKFEQAKQKIIMFESTVNATSYTIIPGSNHEGDHLSRAANLIFMYEEKIIPYAY